MTLNQFNHLKKAFIDASSLIYAEKAGFLYQLHQALQLYTLPTISEEAKLQTIALHIVQRPDLAFLSPDRQLITCAIEYALPVISEDKTILTCARKANLPYYNALMMVNFLLFHKRITLEAYGRYSTALQQIARYSRQVWEYGESIHQLIILSHLYT